MSNCCFAATQTPDKACVEGSDTILSSCGDDNLAERLKSALNETEEEDLENNTTVNGLAKDDLTVDSASLFSASPSFKFRKRTILNVHGKGLVQSCPEFKRNRTLLSFRPVTISSTDGVCTNSEAAPENMLLEDRNFKLKMVSSKDVLLSSCSACAHNRSNSTSEVEESNTSITNTSTVDSAIENSFSDDRQESLDGRITDADSEGPAGETTIADEIPEHDGHQQHIEEASQSDESLPYPNHFYQDDQDNSLHCQSFLLRKVFAADVHFDAFVESDSEKQEELADSTCGWRLLSESTVTLSIESGEPFIGHLYYHTEAGSSILLHSQKVDSEIPFGGSSRFHRISSSEISQTVLVNGTRLLVEHVDGSIWSLEFYCEEEAEHILKLLQNQQLSYSTQQGSLYSSLSDQIGKKSEAENELPPQRMQIVDLTGHLENLKHLDKNRDQASLVPEARNTSNTYLSTRWLNDLWALVHRSKMNQDFRTVSICSEVIIRTLNLSSRLLADSTVIYSDISVFAAVLWQYYSFQIFESPETIKVPDKKSSWSLESGGQREHLHFPVPSDSVSEGLTLSSAARDCLPRFLSRAKITPQTLPDDHSFPFISSINLNHQNKPFQVATHNWAQQFTSALSKITQTSLNCLLDPFLIFASNDHFYSFLAAMECQPDQTLYNEGGHPSYLVVPHLTFWQTRSTFHAGSILDTCIADIRSRRVFASLAAFVARLLFIRDVCLPRYLDEFSLARITWSINCATGALCRIITQRAEHFFSCLAEILPRDPSALHFLHHLLAALKTLSNNYAREKETVLQYISVGNVIESLEVYFCSRPSSKPDEDSNNSAEALKTSSSDTEIPDPVLSSSVFFKSGFHPLGSLNVQVVATEIIQHCAVYNAKIITKALVDNSRRNNGYPRLWLSMAGMFNLASTPESVVIQMAEVFKVILLQDMVQARVRSEDLLSLFYDHGVLNTLIGILLKKVQPGQQADVSTQYFVKAQILGIIISCLQSINSRMRYRMAESDIIGKLVNQVKSIKNPKSSGTLSFVMAVVRFLKAFVSCRDSHYPSLSNRDILGPLLQYLMPADVRKLQQTVAGRVNKMFPPDKEESDVVVDPTTNITTENSTTVKSQDVSSGEPGRYLSKSPKIKDDRTELRVFDSNSSPIGSPQLSSRPSGESSLFKLSVPSTKPFNSGAAHVTGTGNEIGRGARIERLPTGFGARDCSQMLSVDNITDLEYYHFRKSPGEGSLLESAVMNLLVEIVSEPPKLTLLKPLVEKHWEELILLNHFYTTRCRFPLFKYIVTCYWINFQTHPHHFHLNSPSLDPSQPQTTLWTSLLSPLTQTTSNHNNINAHSSLSVDWALNEQPDSTNLNVGQTTPPEPNKPGTPSSVRPSSLKRRSSLPFIQKKKRRSQILSNFHSESELKNDNSDPLSFSLESDDQNSSDTSSAEKTLVMKSTSLHLQSGRRDLECSNNEKGNLDQSEEPSEKKGAVKDLKNFEHLGETVKSLDEIDSLLSSAKPTLDEENDEDVFSSILSNSPKRPKKKDSFLSVPPEAGSESSSEAQVGVANKAINISLSFPKRFRSSGTAKESDDSNNQKNKKLNSEDVPFGDANVKNK